MWPSRPVRALLLAVLGVALVGNGFWLFPSEGESEYTLARSEITVENGTLAYRGSETLGPAHEYNDLAAVGCDGYTGARACAFDRYLIAHGPVRLAHDEAARADIAFVRLDDRYYHRTSEELDNASVYDVERIAPRDLLAEIAHDYSDVSPSADLTHLPVGARVAVTGERATTTELPNDEVGRVYLLDGTYYTVVVVEEGVVDVPVFEEWMGSLAGLGGLTLLLVALFVGVGPRNGDAFDR